MGMAYMDTVCNRCNADIPADKVRGNENWCSPACEPVQMRELRAELTRLRDIEAKARAMLVAWNDGDNLIEIDDAIDALYKTCFPEHKP